MMVKMEMCLLMNLANIYDNGSFSISFSEGEGALMKKCVIWIIPTMSPGHFKRRGNIFSIVLDMDILEWKMLWKTQTRIILKRKKVEQEEKEEEEKEEEIEEEEEEEEEWAGRLGSGGGAGW